MEYLQEQSGYQLYRNKEGCIEAWKTTGEKDNKRQLSGSDVAHVVTTCKTVAEFIELIGSKKVKFKPKIEPPPSLF